MQRFISAFLRQFFRLLYGPFAWTYDGVAALVSVGRWQDWVAAVIPYLNNSGPVLELGHGPGHLQASLLKTHRLVVGLDASLHMGRLARMLLQRDQRMAFLLVSGYAQYLPFPDAFFQSAVATFPTEYIYSTRTASEIFRILRPGGELVVLPLAWICPGHLLDRLAAGLFRIIGQAPAWDPRLLQPFEQAGFSTSTEILQQPGSMLLLLHALKPGTG